MAKKQTTTEAKNKASEKAEIAQLKRRCKELEKSREKWKEECKTYKRETEEASEINKKLSQLTIVIS